MVQYLLCMSRYSVSVSKCIFGVGLETLQTVPKLLQPSHHLTKPLVKDTHELCAHETRWTEASLRQLHQDLKGNIPN